MKKKFKTYFIFHRFSLLKLAPFEMTLSVIERYRSLSDKIPQAQLTLFDFRLESSHSFSGLWLPCWLCLLCRGYPLLQCCPGPDHSLLPRLQQFGYHQFPNVMLETSAPSLTKDDLLTGGLMLLSADSLHQLYSGHLCSVHLYIPRPAYFLASGKRLTPAQVGEGLLFTDLD